MVDEGIQGLVVFLAIIFGIIIYLIMLNILKFIVSITFISKLIKDFKESNKKYIKSKEYKDWVPWKFS